MRILQAASMLDSGITSPFINCHLVRVQISILIFYVKKRYKKIGLEQMKICCTLIRLFITSSPGMDRVRLICINEIFNKFLMAHICLFYRVAFMNKSIVPLHFFKLILKIIQNKLKPTTIASSHGGAVRMKLKYQTKGIKLMRMFVHKANDRKK